MGVRLLGITLSVVFFVAMGGSTAALPGDGEDGHCDGRVATKAEIFEAELPGLISSAQSLRSVWGMRSDEAYVEQLLRDPRYRDSIRRFGTALTPEESRYAIERWALSRSLFRRIREYLNQRAKFALTAAGTAYGLTIVDDYPRDAYIVVRLPSELMETHAHALSALSPRIRVIALPTASEFEQALARVEKGRAQLEAQGILIWEVGVDVDRGAVVVRFTSDRPDASRLIEARLGPFVLAEPGVQPVLTASNASRTRSPKHRVCTSPDGYLSRRDGRTLEVFWGTRSSTRVRVSARESATTVRVRLIERFTNSRFAPLCRRTRLKLRAPLGGRAVIDAETGQRLQRLSEDDVLARHRRWSCDGRVSRRRAR